MIKTAIQLKDLIRNLSKKKSADAQILMRNYMMERFLERISVSKYKDKFILKGGMLVAAMVGLDARATMDIDATIKGADVNVEAVENIIAEIVSVPLEDGVTFRIKQISEIMDEADYPGVRVSMETEFDGARTPLGNNKTVIYGDTTKATFSASDTNSSFHMYYDIGTDEKDVAYYLIVVSDHAGNVAKKKLISQYSLLSWFHTSIERSTYR